MLGLLGLNDLPGTDIALFIVLALIIGLAVAIYFLIPVFNKKQYREQRENLHKREAAFHANKAQNADSQVTESENAVQPAEDQQASHDADPLIGGADGK